MRAHRPKSWHVLDSGATVDPVNTGPVIVRRFLNISESMR